MECGKMKRSIQIKITFESITPGSLLERTQEVVKI